MQLWGVEKESLKKVEIKLVLGMGEPGKVVRSKDLLGVWVWGGGWEVCPGVSTLVI